MTLIEFLQTTKQNPTQFAAAIGVAPSTVMRWVSGARTPTVDFLMKIKGATCGSVDVEDFAKERAAKKRARAA